MKLQLLAVWSATTYASGLFIVRLFDEAKRMRILYLSASHKAYGLVLSTWHLQYWILLFVPSSSFYQSSASLSLLLYYRPESGFFISTPNFSQLAEAQSMAVNGLLSVGERVLWVQSFLNNLLLVFDVI
ncbi:hypothetical protein BDP27DRAFT_627991 [Rhodocollybia butyracea]|uniref:Uncharacterized protein n=1 Tax=Rhodocollybia butyracea TaxID=206335 RepID=A0A9P5P9G2_9AGAR|nr:hypothetical protein BDP27DRAFT_627991 [Rhodocollybia butyracea]